MVEAHRVDVVKSDNIGDVGVDSVAVAEAESVCVAA